jgi:hypothetical protein
MYLENLYQEMRAAQLVASAYEFSEKYLGRSRNYYSVLKARNMEPSIGAILALEYALQKQVDIAGSASTEDGRAKLGCVLMLSHDVASYRIKRCVPKSFNQNQLTMEA